MPGINMANITAHPTTMLTYASNLRCLSGIQHVQTPISTTSAYPSTTAGTTSIHSGQLVLVAAFDTKSIQHGQQLLTETPHVLKPGVDACDMSTQSTARRSGKRNTASTAHGPALGLQKENLFQHASGVIKKTMVIFMISLYNGLVNLIRL
jgi:hypothetical protein